MSMPLSKLSKISKKDKKTSNKKRRKREEYKPEPVALEQDDKISLTSLEDKQQDRWRKQFDVRRKMNASKNRKALF